VIEFVMDWVIRRGLVCTVMCTITKCSPCITLHWYFKIWNF
jgi:hypothetical protein